MPKKNLNQELLDEPYRFDFFQAIRLLEKIYPDRAPLSRSATPDNEVIRIRGNPSLRFPPSQISKIETSVSDKTDEEITEMTVNFMGMVGISGVLPSHYSELIVDRARYGDTALQAFIDMFTHRAVSMFYRAWEKYRFPV